MKQFIGTRLSHFLGFRGGGILLILFFSCPELSASDVRVPPQRPNQMDVSQTTPGRTPELSAGAGDARRFGPYQALTYDPEILQEVVVKDPNNTIWLRLNPEFKDKEIRIKISNAKFENYRRWYSGQNTIEDGYVLVSPAFAGKGRNQLTDWLRTSASFIEYYMDGKLFLHLEREGS